MSNGTFVSLDANSGALKLDGTSAELFRMNVVTFEVTSDVLPWFWVRAMSRTLRKMSDFLTVAERKTLDFASLLLSVGDVDGGSDSAMDVSVGGNVVTASVSAPANSTVLLSIQRRGGSVKPVAAPAPAGGGGSVDLSAYARKSELPDISGLATKAELPSLTPYALKTELPSIAGLLTSSDAVATYATKAALSEVAGFAPDRVLYVAKNGNDSLGNGSQGKPFASITKAMEAANAVSGGYLAVFVGPGEYAENVSITRARTVLIGCGTSPEDHATSLMGSLTVDCSSATQKYNDVVSVKGIYVNDGAKVTGTGAFMTVFTDCYLTTGVAATNAVLVDNSHADRSIVYLRNCTATKQSSATTDVVKLSRGDVRMDTVRIYGAISGTGNGVLVSNNASLRADRLEVDINMEGVAVKSDGAYAGVALMLSNSSLKTNYKGSGAAPALYIKNDTGIGAFLWQVVLQAADTAAGKYAIDGVANATAASGTVPLIYGHVTFGPGTCTALGAQVSAAKVKMSDLA